MSVAGLVALQLTGLAFLVSLAVTGFAKLGGLGDVPDHRSSHARTTPTAGGLGILAGFSAGVLFAASYYQGWVFVGPAMAETFATTLSLTFAVAFLGLLDDLYDLSARLKFALMVFICLMAAKTIGVVTMLPFGDDHIYLLWWSGLLGTALWLFVVMNSVNFMDGINGLFGLSMAIASFGLCVLAVKVGAPVTALISGLLFASLCGFLPYNFRRKAGVFSGDCGSLSTAFLYGCAVLYLVKEQPEMKLLYVGPLLILPLLVDVLVTLIRKPMNGIALTAPHSTHLYQRWARSSGSHLTVSLIYAMMISLLSMLVQQAYDRGTIGSLWGFGLVTGILICLYLARSATLPD